MKTSTNPEPVTCRREANGLAVVTIDRPKRRNALNLDVKRRLTTIIETLVDDPVVRVIILTGAQGVFVAGTDVAEMAGMTPTEHTLLATDQVFTALRRCPKILIAAVEGYAPWRRLRVGVRLRPDRGRRERNEPPSFGHQTKGRPQ